MGRHARKGGRNNGDTGAIPVVPSASGASGTSDGTGRRRRSDVTPPQGVPRMRPDMTPPQGMPRVRPDMTPPRGMPQARPGMAPPPGGPAMTPPRGVPRVRPDGTPAHGTPRVPPPGAGRPHPQQREGGGWGAIPGGPQQHTGPLPRVGETGPLPRLGDTGPQQRITSTGPQPRVTSTGPQPRIPGPRREYVSAFDGLGGLDGADGPDGLDPLAEEPDLFDPAARRRTGPKDPYAAVTDFRHELSEDEAPPAAPVRRDPPHRATKGRTFTGIAAAAVTTVLAVVVAGQVADGREQDPQARAAEANGGERGAASEASRSDDRASTGPSTPSPTPLTYEQKLAKKAKLPPHEASGEFETIGGTDKAPGKGRKYRYRVDVEKGLGMDSALFAEAIHRTLNDERSWAHKGERTFERVSSGEADFVITLASSATTAVWCAKSGLDTAEQNVSCDSAATERVMINADRWAQGAETYGDAIGPYRQMLINHEIGHRLGFDHVNCSVDGALAPVMQQQTKTLEIDGVKCRANPWVHPKA